MSQKFISPPREYDVIGIDEGQFFPDIVTWCEEMANRCSRRWKLNCKKYFQGKDCACCCPGWNFPEASFPRNVGVGASGGGGHQVAGCLHDLLPGGEIKVENLIFNLSPISHLRRRRSARESQRRLVWRWSVGRTSTWRSAGGATSRQTRWAGWLFDEIKIFLFISCLLSRWQRHQE